MADKLQVFEYRTVSPSTILANIETLARVAPQLGLPDKEASFTVHENTGYWEYAISTEAQDRALVIAHPMDVKAATSIAERAMDKLQTLLGALKNSRVLTKDFPDRLMYKTRQAYAISIGPQRDSSLSDRWELHYVIELPSHSIVTKDDDVKTNVAQTQRDFVRGESVLIEVLGMHISRISYNRLPVLSVSRYEVQDENIINHIIQMKGTITLMSAARFAQIIPFYEAPDGSLIPVTQSGRSLSPSLAPRLLPLDAQDGLSVPFIRPAPRGAMPMSYFIDLVRLEEQKYSVSEQMNTKAMVSRLRKIFYNTEKGWDKYLIPGAAHIIPPYSTYRTRVRSRKRVKPWGPLNNFDLVDEERYPIDDSGRRPLIYMNQNVLLDAGPVAGAYIDMGHVFAGWDAFNHPGPVQAPYLREIKINRNWDAVTWVGDLGSVLAEAWVVYVNGEESLTTAKLQSLIDDYAPAEDMLGNVDSYVLSTQGFKGKVSDILEAYYYDESNADIQRRRFEIFSQEIGIGPFVGGKLLNASSRALYYSDEIDDAAAMYIGAGMDNENILGKPWNTPLIAMRVEFAFLLYSRMVDSINKLLLLR